MKLTDIIYDNQMTSIPKQNICLIGMASDGPVCKPFFLNKDTDVFSLLGENQMAYSYDAIEKAGIAREKISIYRLNGEHGSIELSKDNEVFIRMITVGASDEDRTIAIQTGFKSITIKKTIYEEYELTTENGPIVDSKIKNIETRTFSFDIYPTLDLLTDAINRDATLGIVEVLSNNLKNGYCTDYFVEQKEYLFLNSHSQENYVLEEGTLFETHKTNYWEKLFSGIIGDDSMSFQPALQLINSEIMVFTDVYYDSFPEAGSIIARFAQAKSEECGREVFSLMNTSPVPGLKNPPEWYFKTGPNTWMSEDGEVTIDPYEDVNSYLDKLTLLGLSSERNASHMNHLQVTVGDSFYQNTKIPISPYYAATFISTPFYQPVSNKQMTNPYYGEEISKSSIAILQSSGYICCVPSIRRNCVPFGAQSFSRKEGTVLSFLHNQRIVSIIVNDLKEIFDSFIGYKKKEVYNPAILSNQITSYLSQFTNQQLIQTFSLNFPEIQDIDDPEELNLSVNLSLYNETHNIQAGFSIEDRKGAVNVWKLLS